MQFKADKEMYEIENKIGQRKDWKTYKNIHQHVLQGHLYVLEPSCKSHRSADPKNATKENLDFFQQK